jgi:ribosomal protein S18 acetylase RimI-like enzyme
MTLDQTESDSMEINQATITDAEEILDLQKQAFLEEAKRYNNFDIPPLHQTIEELEEDFSTHVVLKAISDNKIIGTVRAYEDGGTCYIGRLAVRPELQNRGIGTALMREIEHKFSPRRFELFVGDKSDNNIHLYTKLGYSVFKTGGDDCGAVEILFMEKWCESSHE